MRFIHLTDRHVVGSGLFHDLDPSERLSQAVASINAEHSDADFVIFAGYLTDWGDAQKL
ncbi:hypothetical protein [Primorskyibacter sp. S187A]|uniref:hypothetical protein n=1 Tax=Primorskyibacter sp. S187A TaxID=3415130 RepID=UPI003C7D5C7C